MEEKTWRYRWNGTTVLLELDCSELACEQEAQVRRLEDDRQLRHMLAQVADVFPGDSVSVSMAGREVLQVRERLWESVRAHMAPAKPWLLAGVVFSLSLVGTGTIEIGAHGWCFIAGLLTALLLASGKEVLDERRAGIRVDLQARAVHAG